jgi:hypothetical protein
MENRIMASLDTLLTLSSGIKASELGTLGVTGASLGITPASLGVVDAETRLFREVTDGTRRPWMIPSITTVNERNQSWWQVWSSGESWTSYYNYLTGTTQADCERAFWFSLGTNTRQNTVGYATSSFDNNRIIYAKNSVVGNDDVHIAHGRNQSYSPFRLRTMFLRNHHPTLQKSVTMYGSYSNYWSSGHDGSGVCIGTPNANGSYNAVTDINWTVPVNRTGGNSYYQWSWTVTIPAKTTVSVTQTNTMYYWQSGYVHWYLDQNMFYDLHTTFSDFWIQPDLKMTHAALTYNDHDNQFNIKTSYKIWNRTAVLFGDR